MTKSVDRWPHWEVFVRNKRGLDHVHVGSVLAPDSELALLGARDVYTRRAEGVSLWVVRSDDIIASHPEDAPSFYLPGQSKKLRHATSYDFPDDVENM
jgi:ring-1,2-phenylacetyl-CoA epoxidase subunit PaaB